MSDIVIACGFLVTFLGFVFTWIAVVFGAGKRVGKLETRVDTLERQPEKVTVLSCGRQQTDCKMHFESELAHGSKEFTELSGDIKSLAKVVSDNEKANQNRHIELLKELRKSEV